MQQTGGIVIGVGFQHRFWGGHWLGQQLLQVYIGIVRVDVVGGIPVNLWQGGGPRHNDFCSAGQGLQRRDTESLVVAGQDKGTAPLHQGLYLAVGDIPQQHNVWQGLQTLQLRWHQSGKHRAGNGKGVLRVPLRIVGNPLQILATGKASQGEVEALVHQPRELLEDAVVRHHSLEMLPAVGYHLNLLRRDAVGGGNLVPAELGHRQQQLGVAGGIAVHETHIPADKTIPPPGKITGIELGINVVDEHNSPCPPRRYIGKVQWCGPIPPHIAAEGAVLPGGKEGAFGIRNNTLNVLQFWNIPAVFGNIELELPRLHQTIQPYRHLIGKPLNSRKVPAQKVAVYYYH